MTCTGIIALCILLVSVSNIYGTPLSNVGIVGGHSISIEEVPYMASLRIYNATANTTSHMCGASIFHDRFLISAAHCIIEDYEYKVLVGTDQVDTGGELYDTEEVIPHKKFSFVKPDFDIALIKVSRPIIFGPRVAKIALANKTIKFKAGTQVDATGWGITESGSDVMSNKLLQTSLPIVKRSDCQLAMESFFNITKKMICAGGNGKDTCQGDSGGPLTLGKVLIGITSFGIGCGGVTPGVYTEVSKMLPWIERNIKANE